MAMEHFTSAIQGAFSILGETLNGASSGPLHAARAQALATLLELGVPTTRHEEWKYTNLAPILANDFVPAIGTPEAPSAKVLDGLDLVEMDAWRVVIVNGVLQLALSTLPSEQDGLTIEELTDEIVQTDEEVGRNFGAIATTSTQAFVAANTSLTIGGVLVRVQDNVAVSKPIHVISIVSTSIGNTFCAPRILLLARPHSSVTMVESHHTVGRGKGLTASVTEVDCAEGAKVAYTKLLDDGQNGHHIGATAVNIAHAATATAMTACLNGTFMRNDLVMRLNAPTAEAYLYGISVLNDAQVADNHTVVDHRTPHCHSEELYKGLYDGRSVGVFNGKIFVREDAQKTTAYQSNHSLLLSDHATVNAKPQLEIWADDVKCSHGATSGQLNEEAIFYLQSRGIGKEEARGLLTYAFAAEVADHVVNDDVREHIERRIADKLGARRFDH